MNYSRGMGLIEILLTIALSAIFISSTSVYVYSLHPHVMLKNILGGEIKKAWIHPKIWKEEDVSTRSARTYIVDESIQGQKSCSDVDISTRVVTYFTSEELDVSSTSIATGIGMIGDIVYISFNSSSTTDPDLIIYRKEGGVLTKISSLNTGPGVSDMVIAGLTIFLANTSVNSQAQRIDVSDELHPKLVDSYVIPGSNSVTSPISKKVFVYKDMLYIGTEKSVLPEIHLFNIQTGAHISSVDTEYGINGFYVRDKKLYVLSPKDPEVEIFDSKTLVRIDSFDAPQSLGNGRSMNTSGEYIFLGRSKGDNEIYNLSVPLPPNTNWKVNF